MFSSWFHGRQQPPPPAGITVTVRTEHVEVIGGGSQSSIDYSQLPLLPPELVVQIILAAAESILQDSYIPSREKYRHLLQLASVNLECYKAILSHVLLQDVVLSGLSQIQAFQQSLDDDRHQVFRGILRHRLTRLVVVQHHKTGPNNSQRRHALFDSVTRLQEFDKAASIRPLLRHCHSLQSLHLETTPRVLCEKRRFDSMGPNFSAWPKFQGSAVSNDMSDLTKLKESLREFSCVLGSWGGVGLEDIFVGVIKPSRRSSSTTTTTTTSQRSSSPPRLQCPIIRQPWGNLTHLQITGISGFRVSMATASSIGSLPRLTHLGLCMPNVTRDASMAGDVNSPPAALQLLVLLAHRLKELIVVGHRLEGFMGWSRLYAAWLSALRLTVQDGKEVSRREDLKVKLITAEVGSGGGQAIPSIDTPHPNHFSSWMMARTREASHWSWDKNECIEGYRSLADKAWNVHWEVEEWMVPIDVIPANEYAEENRPVGQATVGGGRQSNTPQPATRSEEEIFGIDNLD